MSGIRRRSALLSGLCLLLLHAPVLAQTGTILGRITGSGTGWPVVGALVEARGPGNRGSGSVLTNQEGTFRIPGLAPGFYVVSVAAVGYATQVIDSVQVTPDGTATVSMSLAPTPVELNPLVITGSRKAEKALESPAHVAVLEEREIDERPALTLVDHLRSAVGLDVWTGGLQSTRVVARGFNSIFSGSLHTLTDNRITGAPSMRVNIMYMVPQTSDDIERMELVLGPGAALYGPNTAKGVLHIITKSPIDDPGSALSVAGGERGVLHLTGRTAVRLSSRFGVRISGQYFQGNDWRYIDPVETAARQEARDDFDAWKLTQPVGLTEAELRRRAGLIAARDFDVARYSWDARADWRPTPDLSVVLTTGRTHANRGIELSGAGATMLDNWTYRYYQARLSHGRWFAQGYLNANDAGDTFMLRTGAPIVDRSKLWVAQLQHGASWRNLDLTYGGDLMVTRPETGGTIHGSHEEQDDYAEYGAYLQAKAGLSPKLDLLLAGRWDRHTTLNDGVLSPRAALVVKPTPGQTFRLTYNRAFSTPTSLSQFIDMDGGPAGALGSLGFRTRAHGSGKEGFHLADRNGWPLGMRVPGHPGLVDVTAGNVYDAQLALLVDRLQGNPATADLVPLLQQLGPALKMGAAQLPIVALYPEREPLPVAGSVEDVPGARSSISSVWEAGYKGLLGDRLLLAADLWRSTESDFLSPLLVQTPLFLLDPQQLGSFLSQNAAPRIVSALVQAGQPEAMATQLAQMVIASWVQIPGGVAGSDEVETRGADLLLTNVNGGEVDFWGFDLSAQWLVSDAWSTSLTYSHVSDHTFCLVDAGATGCGTNDLLLLNAPRDKLTGSLAYRGPGNGFSGELRVRHTGAFPVSASGYDAESYETRVNPYTLLDLTLGAGLPGVSGASVQLAVTNLLDEDYRSFVGVPNVGRLALLRLRHEF